MTIALALSLAAVAVLQERLAVGRERRERMYALRATVALAGLLAGTAVFRLAVSTATEISLVVVEAGLAALAIVLVRTLLREPWARPATDFVVEVTGTRSGALRDQLARVLGDRTLEIGFPVDGGYVDAAGRVLALPADGPRRTTVIEHDGAPVAVLIHDAALIDDPALAAALSEAAELGGVKRAPAGRSASADPVQCRRRGGAGSRPDCTRASWRPTARGRAASARQPLTGAGRARARAPRARAGRARARGLLHLLGGTREHRQVRGRHARA